MLKGGRRVALFHRIKASLPLLLIAFPPFFTAHRMAAILTAPPSVLIHMSASPRSQTIYPGQSASYSITVTSIGGYNSRVAFALFGCPRGVGFEFDPPIAVPPPGGESFSMLTIRADRTTPVGTYTLTVCGAIPTTGHNYDYSHFTTVTLIVAKTPTIISCSLDAYTITHGQSVTISGSISPNPGVDRDVVLEYSTDEGATWKVMATVKTDLDGRYTYTWSQPSAVECEIRATWAGSSTYDGDTSPIQTLLVQRPACLIATATYRSALSPEVQFLRNFRDKTVMTTFAGSQFMTVFNAWYYSFSPHVAEFVAKSSLIGAVVKVGLYPLIGILHLAATTFSLFGFSSEFGVVVAGLLASSLVGIVYCSPLAIASLLIVERRRKLGSRMGRLKPFTLAWMASIGLLSLAEIAGSSIVMMISATVFVLLTLGISTLVTIRVAEHFLAKS